MTADWEDEGSEDRHTGSKRTHGAALVVVERFFGEEESGRRLRTIPRAAILLQWQHERIFRFEDLEEHCFYGVEFMAKGRRVRLRLEDCAVCRTQNCFINLRRCGELGKGGWPCICVGSCVNH